MLVVIECFQNALMWVSLSVAVVLAAAGAFVWCDESEILPGRRILHAFVRLPWLVRLFLTAFVVQLVVHGSTKTNQTNGVEGGTTNQTTGVSGGTTNQTNSADGGTTNPPPAMAGLLLGGPRGSYGVEAVTDEDIARGYRLERVSTNADCSFALPANGVLCGHWHQRGAYDDVTCVDFGDWTFPLGTSEVSRLWAFVNGSARPALRDTIHEIAPVGTPLSAIPSVSRLWTAATSNDARLVTWENFAIGRLRLADYPLSSTDYPLLSAQIELHSDGDFVTRSNEVEIAYRRVDPNDWDGDGWHNDDDPSPKVWTDGAFGLEQSLPTNANADAYCWIDVRSAYNTCVRFVGDGPSNLPDPAFTARAGTLHRVMLLIGKRYEVTSDRPLSVVNRSSDEIEVDGNDTTALSIRYPVNIYALEGNGRGFRMIARPAGLGGHFTWTNSCCDVYGDSDVFRYGCSSNCACTGCAACGYYAYEGYRLFAEGGSCGCSSYPGDDPNEDSPGASVSFSKSVIFLEDAYANTPTNTVPWQSTDTLLTCDANGGDNGGVVTFSIAGGTNLIQYTGQPLPYTRTLGPDETLHFVNRYGAVAESATEKDIVVTATFVENATDWRSETEAKATAVKVLLTPIVSRDGCEHRHVMGVRERLQVEIHPNCESSSVLLNDDWTADDHFGMRLYLCPGVETHGGLTIGCDDCSYLPSLEVIEPNGVVCHSGQVQLYQAAVGEAGGIGMKLDLTISPEHVCFSGLAFVEVPSVEGCRTGYFTNSLFDASQSHTVENGAGDWHDISPDNHFFDDYPGLECSCPSPWSAGVINWAIPIAWGDRGTCRLIDKTDNLSQDYRQVFTMDSAGGVKVEKFDRWVKRMPNGTVSASPGIVN